MCKVSNMLKLRLWIVVVVVLSLVVGCGGKLDGKGGMDDVGLIVF